MHSVTAPSQSAAPGPWPRYTKGTGGCIKVGISLGPAWCELWGRYGRAVPPCAPLRALHLGFSFPSPRPLAVSPPPPRSTWFAPTEGRGGARR